MSRLKELQEELKTVLSGRGARLLDSFLPLLVFLIANPMVGVNIALGAALAVTGVFAVFRIIKKESLVYALGGFGGVLLAGIFVKLSGSDTGFFLPGLISGAITIVLCTVSVVINRPLVAWMSFITRRWPLDWYWHPRVLPAYNEGAVNALGVTKILLGWPFIVILLIASYLYGLWRLDHLNGPGVEEFKTGKEPPWLGQKRGF